MPEDDWIVLKRWFWWYPEHLSGPNLAPLALYIPDTCMQACHMPILLQISIQILVASWHLTAMQFQWDDFCSFLIKYQKSLWCQNSAKMEICVQCVLIENKIKLNQLKLSDYKISSANFLVMSLLTHTLFTGGELIR
jgi:hypothetical protein